MIHTVFVSPAQSLTQWQAELLEYSWGAVRQRGELVRLMPGSGSSLPKHRSARVVPTRRWSKHPFTGDVLAAYDMPAALMEWLVRERVRGTVLLLEPDSVFRSALRAEVPIGHARGTAWPDIPTTGSGPFGLSEEVGFLRRFCVDRSLELPGVRLPLLINAHDLRRVAPRWLELMGILRAELDGGSELRDKCVAGLAYNIAAAEYEIVHATVQLGVETGRDNSRARIVRYRRPIESASGETVWDARTYTPWKSPDPARAATATDREFLEFLRAVAGLRAAAGEIGLVLPKRREGVREGRVAGHVVLQIPSRVESLSLNPSAAAIWDLCDDERTLAEIMGELERRFGTPAEALRSDLEATIDLLASVGALDVRWAVR